MYKGEYVNSISHLVGTVLALVGLGFLLSTAIPTGKALNIVSFSVYGLTLVLLFAMSTLYHSFKMPRVKRVFKVLDHVAIYLLIAGTYTPIMLLTLGTPSGWMILGLVWGLALVGIASELFLRGKAVKIGQVVIYLAMGWACVLKMDEINQSLDPMARNLMLAGGLVYTGGVIFYVLDKVKSLRFSHAHGIWHFFVLAGAILHFVLIQGYVS